MSNSLLTPRRLQVEDPVVTDSRGAQQLKQLQAINYICLALFLVLVIGLIYIIKKHFTKYVNFYIIRKDYLRLKPVPTKVNSSTQHEKTSFKQNNMSIRQKFVEYQRNLVQNLSRYHPYLQLLISKVYKQAFYLPNAINIGLIMVFIVLLLTFSLLLSKINSSFCVEQRFTTGFTYFCSLQQNSNNIGDLTLQFGIAVLVVCLSLIIIFPGTYFISRNYYEFMYNLRTSTLQAKSVSQEHHPTLQNMLGEDSEFSRRSLKPANTNKAQSKNLFQINEAEEEEPFSPSKNHYSEIQIHEVSNTKSVLGENKNINNTSQLKQSQNNMLAPKNAEYEYQINDPPQFSSYTKDNDINEEQIKAYSDKNLVNTYSQSTLNTKGIMSQFANYQARPRSQVKSNRYGNQSSHRILNSVCGLSESTNMQECFGPASNQPLQNDSSNKNMMLEGIEEDIENEKIGNTIRTSNHKSLASNEKAKLNSKNTPGKIELSQTSKEESKEEDSSRIFMMNKQRTSSELDNKNIQHLQDQSNSPMKMLKISLFLLVIISCLVLSILYIAYSFYNMTTAGLSNVLTIFGFSMLIDIVILRLSVILILSIFTTANTFTQSKPSHSLIQLDEDKLSLLGEIYQDYELPISQQPYFYHQQQNQVSVTNRKQEENSGDEIEAASDIEQQKSSQRIIKVNNKRKGYIGELMLVESTYFYHQGMDIKRKSERFEPQQEQPNIQNVRSSSKKAKPQGEKVTVSGSMKFNADDMKFKKAHTERLRIHDEESSYDIEEIPIYSSRNNGFQSNQIDNEIYNQSEQINRSATLPPMLNQHQQFETPKGFNHQRIKFLQPVIPGLNVSQQLITFNECRESQKDQKLLLKSLVLGSNSSKKNKPLLMNQEYQSLQRYLKDDKENVNSNNKKNLMRDSIGSSMRHEKYIDDNNSPTKLINTNIEQIKFAPQYSSLQKQSSSGKNDYKSKFNENRKSLALPEVFSDLKQVNLVQELNRVKKKSKQNSTVSKRASQDKLASQFKNKSVTNQKIFLTSRKNISSPSSIKENLENKMNNFNIQNSIKQQSIIKTSLYPDVSPFHNHKLGDQEEEQNTFIEPPTMNMPSPRDFNILQSIDFNEKPLSDPPKIQDSTSSYLKPFLQPQQHKIKQKVNSQSNNPVEKKSIEDNDYGVIKSNKPNIHKPQIRPKNQGKKHKRKESQITYQTDNSRTGQNVLTMLAKETEDQNLTNNSRMNDSRCDDTSRSKLFEDSDSSTFRLINFGALGSKQRSKKQLLEQQTFQTNNTQSVQEKNSSHIDFYTNGTVTKPKEEETKIYDYKNHDQKSKKQSVAEIIVEENIVTYNSSPEKKGKIEVIEINELSSCKSLEEEPQNKDLQNQDLDQDFNIIKQITNVNQDEYNISNSDDNNNSCNDAYGLRDDILASRLTNRQDLHKTYRTSQMRENSKNPKMKDTYHRGKTSIPSQDTCSVKQNLNQQEELQKKKQNSEVLALRIEDQRRKLKNFMKLAKQLKSAKDEKKIKEFLKYLKEHQKPLPYSKINELKQLEIMNSPYNQSLINMIKDEYDQFNKGDRRGDDGKSKKPSKSQQRNEFKNGFLINKLSGIYGQQLGNTQYSTSQKPKSRENSAGGEYSTRQKLKPQKRNNILSSRSKASKDSYNKDSEIPFPQIFKKRKNRNHMQIIDGSINLSNADDKQIVTLANQENPQNYGMNQSEEDIESRMDELHCREVEQSSKRKNLQELDLSSSNEFNDLQNYLGQ